MKAFYKYYRNAIFSSCYKKIMCEWVLACWCSLLPMPFENTPTGLAPYIPTNPGLLGPTERFHDATDELQGRLSLVRPGQGHIWWEGLGLEGQSIRESGQWLVWIGSYWWGEALGCSWSLKDHREGGISGIPWTIIDTWLGKVKRSVFQAYYAALELVQGW